MGILSNIVEGKQLASSKEVDHHENVVELQEDVLSVLGGVAGDVLGGVLGGGFGLLGSVLGNQGNVVKLQEVEMTQCRLYSKLVKLATWKKRFMNEILTWHHRTIEMIRIKKDKEMGQVWGMRFADLTSD